MSFCNGCQMDNRLKEEQEPSIREKVHFAEEPKLHIYEPDQAAESITSDKVEAILADEKPQEDFCKKQSKRVSFVEKHVVHHYESEDQNVESSADQEYPDSSSQKAWETQENETSQSSIALNDWLDYELDQQVHFQTTERELEALENFDRPSPISARGTGCRSKTMQKNKKNKGRPIKPKCRKKRSRLIKGRIYKPKKPIFIHYHEYYSVVRRAHPSWTPTQLWRHISRKWSNLKDKSMYQQLAREDRDRYHREMLATGKSKGRFLKYPRAFNFYQQERYQQMKQDQPDKSMAEITAMINKEWRATQDKSKWEKLEAQEKEKWTAARKEMEKMQNI